MSEHPSTASPPQQMEELRDAIRLGCGELSGFFHHCHPQAAEIAAVFDEAAEADPEDGEVHHRLMAVLGRVSLHCQACGRPCRAPRVARQLFLNWMRARELKAFMEGRRSRPPAPDGGARQAILERVSAV